MKPLTATQNSEVPSRINGVYEAGLINALTPPMMPITAPIKMNLQAIFRAIKTSCYSAKCYFIIWSMSRIRFDIITIFPKIFDSYFSESIIKRAVLKKKAEIKIHNLRDFSADKKHHKVDDRPFGGGAGMVLMAEPILKAVKNVEHRMFNKMFNKKTKVVIFSAKGKPFNQKIAYDWSKKYKNFIFVTGRYEGIDERVSKILKAEEISIGPYIITDGDVAAMVAVSALVRLIPDVINFSSLEDESFFRKNLEVELPLGSSTSKTELEYPHYTRPEVLRWHGKKYAVPKVLLAGDHKKIEKWRDAKRSKMPR